MAYNGSGTFLINTAGQPVVSGTVISSTAFNALTADLATGLSTAITKDGQTTVTANIPMSTYKFTGLGAGSAATDSANLSQVQSTVSKLLNTITGTNTITATASPTLSAYAAGQMFYFVAAGDNTTAVTLNIDGLGAKSVTRDGSTALISGDIKSGEVVVVVYDGTRFQVVSQVNSAGDATFANVSITSALNVGGVATFTSNPVLSGGTANGVAYLNGSKVLTTGSALTFDGTNLGIGTASPSVKLQVANSNILLSNAYYLSSRNAANTLSISMIGRNASDQVIIDPDGYGTLIGSGGVLGVFGSGNVGIGTSSPGYKLTVQQAIDTYAFNIRDTIGNERILIGSRSTAPIDNITPVQMGNDNAGNLFLSSRTNTASGINFYTNAGTAAVLRATLDSSGNLGIGTASPTGGFRVDVQATTARLRIESTTGTNSAETRTINTGGTLYAGIDSSGGSLTGSAYAAYYFYGGNYPLIFGTNNAERARILSTGEFLAGATSAISVAGVSGFHGLSADANNKWAAVVRNTTSSTPFGLAINYSAAAPNNTSSNFIYCYDSGALRASIRANGGLANYQANNVDLSDARTKKDITPAASMWGKVAALEIVAYKYNDQTHDDVNLGVIAQQVEIVEPVWVDADGFGDTPEDGVPLKTVYTKDITFAAIKALQEAMSRIEKLEAQVVALGAK